MELFLQHIEALIFCSPTPISDEEIIACLAEVFEAEIKVEEVQNAVEELNIKYTDQFAFSIVNSGGGYSFLTKPAYQNVISVHLKQKSKKKLSASALETLSIIAYKQPVSKGDLEKIRGVNCDYAIHKLLEKELVSIVGKSDAVGKPLLYGTSDKFMDYFGINDLADLPSPKEFAVNRDNELGEETIEEIK